LAVRRRSIVLDQDGARGEVRSFVERDGETFAVVDLPRGARLMLPAILLHLEEDGGYTVPVRWSQLASESAGRVSVPLVKEEVSVSVRKVPRERMRVRRRVVTEHREVHTPVWAERVQVEHVQRDVFVERAPAPRREGDTLVLPIVEEVPVVQTRLLLKEEVRIRVVRERRIDRRTIAVRRHEIELEREDINPNTDTDTDEGEPL
jgi:stress response protein YsnF